jgi:hypothetical protein
MPGSSSLYYLEFKDFGSFINDAFYYGMMPGGGIL